MTDQAGQLTPAEWGRIAHIRQYTAEATSGPWTWEDWHVTGMLPHEGPNKQTLTAPAETRPEDLRRYDSTLRNKLLSGEDEAIDLRPEDARFIAESREDVPFLLELVNRMAMWLASEHGRAEGYGHGGQLGHPSPSVSNVSVLARRHPREGRRVIYLEFRLSGLATCAVCGGDIDPPQTIRGYVDSLHSPTFRFEHAEHPPVPGAIEMTRFLRETFGPASEES